MKPFKMIVSILVILSILLSSCTTPKESNKESEKQSESEQVETEAKTEKPTERSTEKKPVQTNKKPTYQEKLALAVSNFDPAVLLDAILLLPSENTENELLLTVNDDLQERRKLTLSTKDGILRFLSKELNSQSEEELYFKSDESGMSMFYRDDSGEWQKKELLFSSLVELFGGNIDISALRYAKMPEMKATDLSTHFSFHKVSHDYIIRFVEENYELLFPNSIFNKEEFHNRLDEYGVTLVVGATDEVLDHISLSIQTTSSKTHPDDESYVSFGIGLSADGKYVKSIKLMQGEDLSGITGKLGFDSNSINLTNNFDENGKYIDTSIVANFFTTEIYDETEKTEDGNGNVGYQYSVAIVRSGLIAAVGEDLEDKMRIRFELTSNADEAYRVSVIENIQSGEKSLKGEPISPTWEILQKNSAWITFEAVDDENGACIVDGKWYLRDEKDMKLSGRYILTEAPSFPNELPQIINK